MLEYWLALQSIALLITIVVTLSNFFEKVFADEEESRSKKFKRLILE
jgi:hypothetical protein